MSTTSSNPDEALELSPGLEFALAVERCYMRLIAQAETQPDAEPSLGGRLFYAGALNAAARALLTAANIAGAASLAVSGDPEACKQAVRDGVADFLVNSLDEALRILKNQLRKRETVAVCIAAAPALVEREMAERGVLPDLLSAEAAAAPEGVAWRQDGARIVAPVKDQSAEEDKQIVVWSVASAPAVWLPKLDAIVLDCLAPEATAARRWLRLAPRYLGRLVRSARLVRADAQTVRQLIARIEASGSRGEIGVPVQSVALPAASMRAQSSFIP